jgi:membrane protease YdiL (CAAX protease family)
MSETKTKEIAELVLDPDTFSVLAQAHAVTASEAAQISPRRRRRSPTGCASGPPNPKRTDVSVTDSSEYPQPTIVGGRAMSALELLFGASLVIAHNVFRVAPNEVPILFLLGLLSIRWRNGGWSAMGLKRPASWVRIVQIALAAAALRILLGEFVIDPLTSRFWPPAAAPMGTEQITGNLGVAILALAFVWTFAAFGEEIAYRGYLLTRAADLGKGSPMAYRCAMVVVSVLFGFGHYYKGPSGIVDSGIAGLILGTAYLLSGRNLWVSILAHGLIDTYAVIVVYFGWQS